MTVKSWVLDRANRMNSLAARGDLPPRDPVPATSSAPAARTGNEPPAHATDAGLAKAEHLGAYAGLIGAIRDELEHFVASHVRLHLAIAERDRFLLTSIDVQCRDVAGARPLLREFMHEFKPEQVKRYLAREVIGGLPNAAAIDLSQFAGLIDATDADAEEGGAYRELLEALRSTPAATTPRPYEVSIVGRWAELDAAGPAAPAPARASGGPAPLTPMAGQRCEFELEDADGRRRVVLQAVVPGRRYVVGKGETCDIRVNATYASRRHAEIWLDNGAWWVADAGSTNGIRVESADGDRGGSVMTAGEQPLALVEGARIVLSARAEGPANEYAWVALWLPPPAATRITPIASSAGAVPKTPLTAIRAARPAELGFTLTAASSSGARTLELRTGALPVSVGRSRNQTLVIDRCHEGVSGHHLDIVDLDDDGAEVEVHGDNGVLLAAAHHGPGSRLHWMPGQTLVLGGSPHEAMACQLTLAREERK